MQKHRSASSPLSSTISFYWYLDLIVSDIQYLVLSLCAEASLHLIIRAHRPATAWTRNGTEGVWGCRVQPWGTDASLDDILAEDMHHWYNKFMRESPSGLITLFELKSILGLQGMNEDANSYVDQVFFTFDMDGDGYIDFVEYIAAISLMLKGEINQKLKWYFKLFDQDGNGKIDKDELETIFTAIQDITRNHDILPEEVVALIFEKIDVEGEGELTLEEFIEGAKDCQFILDVMMILMWVIIVEGRQKPINWRYQALHLSCPQLNIDLLMLEGIQETKEPLASLRSEQCGAF
ncbi:guanylate cyclase activator 1d [Cyprinus carpio]|uniref:Guanylate cyclase activator 1d n=1 Tax=Cyprinus carpio TaxID=7962 RepID=A0A9Q9VLT0_CYPCA|nr:guanylate cyclase activator 1d [Cyprinus carpio]